MRKSIQILLLLLVAVSFMSCSMERRLAARYIKGKKTGAILLLAPEVVYKSSYKVPPMDDFTSLPQEVKDSITYYNSDLVQFMDDSIYINEFMESLIQGFSYFGYEVYYNQSADKFLNTGNETSLIVNVAQMQLEEYIELIKDEISFDPDSTNVAAIYLTAVNFNNWIELTRLNHVKSEPELLFSTQTITDDLNGNFRYYTLTGTFDYEYTIDSLTVNNLYYTAAELGFKHSQWIFDYIMNDYVARNLPPNTRQVKFFSYDFRNKELKRLRWQPFTKL